MLDFDIHTVIDDTTLALFEQEYLWLHIVGHVVLVVTPVALFFLSIRWLALSTAAQYRRITLPLPKKQLGYLALPDSLFGFIFKYSRNPQILLALMALSILPLTYVQLELPKQIINGVIKSNTLEIPFSTTLHNLEKVDFLLLLCGLYLLAILVSSTLKFFLNNKMGITAESLLRRLRLLTIRRSRTHRNNDDTALIPIIITEVEPVCGFASDAIITPLLHGGTFVTIITFMMLQNVSLGIAAITLLPIQLLIIPKLQHKINAHVRDRVKVVRQLSKTLQSSSKPDNRVKLREQVKELQKIRINIFRLKFFMKSLNNFIMNLTPFFFYTIGGFLVLENQLSIGALVASLASYKDLAPAIKELFSYYQRAHDAGLRYNEIRLLVFSPPKVSG